MIKLIAYICYYVAACIAVVILSQSISLWLLIPAIIAIKILSLILPVWVEDKRASEKAAEHGMA